jgi:hypothetical protein
MHINLRNWSLIRIIRLLFGVLGLTAFLMSHDAIFLLIALVLLLQALFNSSCGIGGCGYPMNKKQIQTRPHDIAHTTFEEIR